MVKISSLRCKSSVNFKVTTSRKILRTQFQNSGLAVPLPMLTLLTNHKDAAKVLLAYPPPYPVGFQQASGHSQASQLRHTKEPKEATSIQKAIKPLGPGLLPIQVPEGLPRPAFAPWDSPGTRPPLRPAIHSPKEA